MVKGGMAERGVERLRERRERVEEVLEGVELSWVWIGWIAGS